MEILGFIGAIIGLIAAILNRKRIIVIRTDPGYSSAGSQSRVKVGKRFKRLFLIAGVGFLFFILLGVFADRDEAANVLVWPVFICILAAAYQCAAILLSLLYSLWQ